MKVYVMSKTRNGKLLVPKVSRDFKNLNVEMEAEYHKILKDAGHLGLGLGMLKDGSMVAHYGACKHVWRIDEIIC